MEVLGEAAGDLAGPAELALRLPVDQEDGRASPGGPMNPPDPPPGRMHVKTRTARLGRAVESSTAGTVVAGGTMAATAAAGTLAPSSGWHVDLIPEAIGTTAGCRRPRPPPSRLRRGARPHVGGGDGREPRDQVCPAAPLRGPSGLSLGRHVRREASGRGGRTSARRRGAGGLRWPEKDDRLLADSSRAAARHPAHEAGDAMLGSPSLSPTGASHLPAHHAPGGGDPRRHRCHGADPRGLRRAAPPQDGRRASPLP